MNGWSPHPWGPVADAEAAPPRFANTPPLPDRNTTGPLHREAARDSPAQAMSVQMGPRQAAMEAIRLFHFSIVRLSLGLQRPHQRRLSTETRTKLPSLVRLPTPS